MYIALPSFACQEEKWGNPALPGKDNSCRLLSILTNRCNSF
jgi:hypothetical protein